MKYYHVKCNGNTCGLEYVITDDVIARITEHVVGMEREMAVIM